MAYVAEYQRPYEGGYVNLPSEETPEKAEFMNARDDTIIKIEQFLANLELGGLGGEYALLSEAGYSLGLNIDSNYIMTISLKNKAGAVLDSKNIDFPIESVVVNATYENGKITLTLQNGNTLPIDISDMVKGLVPTTRKIAGIDLADDITEEELKEVLEIDVIQSDIIDLKNLINNGNTDNIDGQSVYAKDILFASEQEIGVGVGTYSLNFDYAVCDSVFEYDFIVAAGWGYVKDGKYEQRITTVIPKDLLEKHATAAEYSDFLLNASLVNTDRRIMFGFVDGVTLKIVSAYTSQLTHIYGIKFKTISKEEWDFVLESIEEFQKPDITTTTETTMPNSYEGRFLFKKIKGVCQQGENPSPTSPQEIKKSVVSGVKTHGKNLLSVNDSTITNKGITCEIKDGKAVLNGTAETNVFFSFPIQELKKEVEYTFLTRNSSASENVLIRLESTTLVSSDNISATTLNNANVSHNFITTQPNNLFVIRVAIGTVLSNFLVQPMLCEGDYTNKAVEFEPYKESSVTLSNPIELYGIGNVQDVIEDGKVKKRFARVVLDGSDDEGWEVQATKNTGVYRLSTLSLKDSIKGCDIAVVANMLCNQFVATTSNSAGTYGCNVGISVVADGRLYIYDETFNTDNISLWKAHLAENPMTVVYELAEKTKEALPTADQVALNSLATYDGITYLEFDSEVQPTFEGEYGTSKVGGYTLEGMLAGRNGELMGKDYANRITALETAMVNNI